MSSLLGGATHSLRYLGNIYSDATVTIYRGISQVSKTSRGGRGRRGYLREPKKERQGRGSKKGTGFYFTSQWSGRRSCPSRPLPLIHVTARHRFFPFSLIYAVTCATITHYIAQDKTLIFLYIIVVHKKGFGGTELWRQEISVPFHHHYWVH